MKRIRYILPLLCNAVFASIALGQTGTSNEALSLEKAITIALQHHPALRASTHLTQAAEYRVDQVRSAYLPQLYFNTSFTRWDWVLPNKRIFLGESLNDLYAEFTVQQLPTDRRSAAGRAPTTLRITRTATPARSAATAG